MAHFIPVLVMIFLNSTMTAHLGVGTTEVKLELGDRMWQPRLSMKQERESPEPCQRWNRQPIAGSDCLNEI